MSSCIEIVKRVKDDVESGKPGDAELRVFDIGMVRHQICLRIESLRSLFGNQCFRLLDVLMSEEELSVQVTQVDGIEVYDMYLAISNLDQVLQQLAADSACANQQNPRLNMSASI